MKKFLLLITVAIIGLGANFAQSANASTLYDCYQKQGKGWPSVSARAADAASFGIWQYKGFASQNKELSAQLCPVGKDGESLLGFSVATGYQKNLRTSMNSTQTTVPVTSLVLKDGTTLSMSNLGGRVFLTIEPGTTREEIVMCTNINSSTVNFDPCTRGLAFAGTSTASVSANQKTHGAGSKVVMSNVHYVYEELTDKDSTEDIGGVKRFTSSSIKIGDATTTAHKSIIADTGAASLPFFRYNVTTSRWQFSDNGTDTVNLATSSAAGLAASTTRAIGITNSLIHVNASSTTGLAFGADGQLYQKVSSTRGVAYDVNGIYLTTVTSTLTFDTNGALQVNASTTASAATIPLTNASGTIPSGFLPRKFGGTGTDGAYAPSSGATTTLDALNRVTLVKNYTSINIPANSTTTISNASTTGSILIMKSQGNCTIAGTIEVTGLGAQPGKANQGATDDIAHYGSNEVAGAIYGNRMFYTTGYASSTYIKTIIVATGAAGATGVTGAATAGGKGGGGAGSFDTAGATGSNGGSSGQAGTAGVLGTSGAGSSGGGGGGGGNDASVGAGGTGGNGGGAVILECLGTLTFTGTVITSGAGGTNGNTGVGGGGGGGGGGGAGMAVLLGETIGTNTGTFITKGGAGGSGGSGGSGSNAGGAAAAASSNSSNHGRVIKNEDIY